MTYIWISKPDFNGKDSASVLNACIDRQIGDISQWSSNYLYAIQKISIGFRYSMHSNWICKAMKNETEWVNSLKIS